MRILAVEFGSWSLKAVELEAKFRRLDILEFHEKRIDWTDKDPAVAYKGAYEDLIKSLPVNPEKIVTSLPAAHVALRFLHMPLTQRKQVEKAYLFELEENVPFKLDDAIIEHFVSRTPDGSLVLAAIAPKRFISQYLTWLQNIGVEADWLTFDGMGLLNLYFSQVAREEKDFDDGPYLLLDIGHMKTTFAIVNEMQALAFRSIAWGGHQVNQTMSMVTGMALEEAERLKINQLDLSVDPETLSGENQDLHNGAVDTYLGFTTELAHNLAAFRNTYQLEPKEVRICGGTAQTKGIIPFLEKQLHLPVKPIHPLAGLSVKSETLNDQKLSIAESLGRGLSVARTGGLYFNFRQQEMAKQNSLSAIGSFIENRLVLKFMAILALFVGILFAHLFLAHYMAGKEANVAVEELRKVFGQTFPNVNSKLRTSLTKNPTDLKKFVDQKNKELEQKVKLVSATKIPSMGIVKQISDAFPPDVKVDVNQLQIEDRKFMIEGVLYSGEIGRITEQLKKSPLFNDVALDQQGQRFTFKGTIVGK